MAPVIVVDRRIVLRRIDNTILHLTSLAVAMVGIDTNQLLKIFKSLTLLTEAKLHYKNCDDRRGGKSLVEVQKMYPCEAYERIRELWT